MGIPPQNSCGKTQVGEKAAKISRTVQGGEDCGQRGRRRRKKLSMEDGEEAATGRGV
jgi:hypothetical protein